MKKPKGQYLFTSESVTEGHPDKVADQVSDAILDEMLAQDPEAHVACETLVTTGLTMISGEISSRNAYVDIPSVVRKTIKEIGYTSADYGFDYNTCAVLTSIDEQSGDIARGVNREKHLEQGAGDQGLMFGYADDETPALMPLPIYYAHKLSRRLAEVRKKGLLDFLRPDGKTQVTIEYDGFTAKKVNTVVLSTQHDPGIEQEELRREVKKVIIQPILQEEWEEKKVEFDDVIIHINPTGLFVDGGPKADTGLTGRKIIVDTYGGMGAHGGGAFSGKDPSKVDRSAAYAARYVAKNIVAAGLAKMVEVQLAYAIGVAEPVSVMVYQFGTGRFSDEKIAACLKKVFDFRPAAIIDRLDLKRPIYKKTASYGHFGRNLPEFTWEQTDMTEDILKNL
ncbi:MAG TPA: methionine adenosyltransferase [Firmicutes bacterium]|jgi:S-adenosylmethionine synthetase|nr:methionine adenosyltransferase [Bacillota bacterium]